MTIFISYRRKDSSAETGRIYDRLIGAFGREAIFKDVDSIPLGVNFKKHLDSIVAKCDVELVVIGPDWASDPRLSDPNDFVRIEVESALQRDIPVVPVLVDGAAMPGADELPESLAELSLRNGMEVGHDPNFHRDMDRLINGLKAIVVKEPEEEKEEKPSPPPPKPAQKPPPKPVSEPAPRPTAPSDLPLAPEVGQKFATSYQLMDVISRSSAAHVFKAEQVALGRIVAIRVLPAYYMQSPSFAANFNRRARLIARLEHARITPVYDFGIENQYPYLVTRYIEGDSLAREIERGALPPERVVAVVSDIAGALDYAHSHGVVHGDIKPTSFIVDSSGAAIVNNFGFVGLWESEEETMLGSVPAYMAPELIQAGERQSQAADIYALGVMAYQMLTGRLPFRGETPTQIALAHLSEPVPDPRDIEPSIPQGMSAAVRRAMAKEPSERYASAGAFAGELRASV
jgi:serine/threonine protein kinase